MTKKKNPTHNRTMILRVYMEMQRYGIVKIILLEKDKFREVMLSDSRFITKLNQGSVVLAKGKT